MKDDPPPVRRIVTGHDNQGKSIILSDGAPPIVISNFAQAGLIFSELWNTPTAPATIDRAGDPTIGRGNSVHPGSGGTVLRIVDFPPEDAQIADAKAAEIFAKISLHAARSKFSEGRHPLMHRTETVDYGIVLSGEITLLLDDSEVTARAGDIVVQRGTIHAWSNRSGRFCRMAFILVDGAYEGDLRRDLADVLPVAAA